MENVKPSIKASSASMDETAVPIGADGSFIPFANFRRPSHKPTSVKSVPTITISPKRSQEGTEVKKVAISMILDFWF